MPSAELDNLINAIISYEKHLQDLKLIDELILYKLNNGARVLQERPHPNGGFVILAVWKTPPDTNGNFVTWRTMDKKEAFWGHYFKDNLQAAVDDYRLR